MTTRIAATAAVAILSCLAAPVEAKDGVYSPEVLPTGQKEISYYADWHQDSTQDVVSQELEFGWGLTLRNQVAAYGVG